jgi:hypothetical protein
MRSNAIVRGRPWRRILSSRRKQVEVMALVLVIVSCGAVALEVAATADNGTLRGEPVPDGDVSAVVEAALSCPALNPPKMAAQIMMASGFKGRADGLAGLDEASFNKWRPSADVSRTDRRANIVALGHRTCENVGHLRAAKLTGDLWPAAVAAERSGLKAVIDAHGVPDGAKSYVDKVKGYANWYAEQPPFAEGSDAPASTMDADGEVKVPDDLVQPIQVAGKMCKEVTPARIAAQLRTMSGFDMNKLSGGREGIAQFTPAMWEIYQTGVKKSVWRSADAIPALGLAMCDMTQQLSNLSGGDPYRLALGAYQWGIDTVRRADGLPRVNVAQWADEVVKRTPEYEKDTRLAAPVAEPAGTSSSASVAPSAPASVAPSAPASSPAQVATGPAKPTKTQNKGPKLFAYDPAAQYEIFNDWADQIVDVPGADEPTVGNDTRLDLWRREGVVDQRWKIQPAPLKDYVVIINARNGMAIGIESRSRNEKDKVAVVTRDVNDANQQWLLEDVGDGKVVMTNKNSGYVMELLGDDIGPPNDNGTTWNGYWIQQLQRDDSQKDQKWRFDKQ